MPLVVGMTRPLSPVERRRFLLQAIGTATATALAFTLAGQPIFRFLGITVNDFRVGGGILLLIFAIHDLLFKVERLASRRDDTLTGVAPLGVPLIIGPAAQIGRAHV